MKRSALFRSITLLLTGSVLTAFSGCGTTPGKSVPALCEEYIRAICDLFINCDKYKEQIETVLAGYSLKQDMDKDECWQKVGDVDPDTGGSKACPSTLSGISVCHETGAVYHQDRLEKCIGQVQIASQKCPEGHFSDYAPACQRILKNESGVDVGICDSPPPPEAGSTDAASSAQDSASSTDSAPQDSAAGG
jgi:hypothetical protein